MANVELVAVGTELLLGQLVDTNTAFIAQRLSEAGIDVRATHAVGDNRERIAALLRDILLRADGAIATGGLGPTIDDVTKEAVCDALGLDVELYGAALEQMERTFAAAGRQMRPNNRKQAELPRGSVPLPNPNGTAPGFVAFSHDGKFVACVPGVPREMKPMIVERLMPYLGQHLEARETIVTCVLHTIGLGESEVDHRIGDLFRSSENPKIAVLAHGYRVDVKIMAKADGAAAAQELIAPLRREIEARLSGFIFGSDDASPASAVERLLEQHRLTLAVAESCTGGRIAAALTSVPGASKTFLGAVVAYDDAVKREQLGITPAMLDAHGAVSAEVAAAMARGVRTRLNAGMGLATTGIAGPSGGTHAKPVGLIWLALDDAAGEARTWRFDLSGDREAIQERATTLALGTLWRYLSRDAGEHTL
ncbi:MAG: competence/damage-inducible protein A [Candidatus Eremiobacteraeota bacterium]|nr:competence/damage-inducible protein A [Candidatus Eremiobacteraeota bacterium]MBV9263736.1 competence/damage-inducible protein A [Candidatus Eremiobacteraeota bacterium]